MAGSADFIGDLDQGKIELTACILHHFTLTLQGWWCNPGADHDFDSLECQVVTASYDFFVVASALDD